MQNTIIISGKNAVKELLSSSRKIHKLYLEEKDRLPRDIKDLMDVASKKNIKTQLLTEVEMAKLLNVKKHQGIAVSVSSFVYSSIDEVLSSIKNEGRKPFLLILDQIEDPQNFGAIIRTAECVGVSAILIEKKNSVEVTPVVERVSQGATSYVKIAKVSNLSSSIKKLKEDNFWVFGADMQGEPFEKVDFSGKVALVIGSEGKGISRLVKENCDFLVSLPLKGKINSLNASVAAGVLMYQVMKYN